MMRFLSPRACCALSAPVTVLLVGVLSGCASIGVPTTEPRVAVASPAAAVAVPQAAPRQWGDPPPLPLAMVAPAAQPSPVAPVQPVVPSSPAVAATAAASILPTAAAAAPVPKAAPKDANDGNADAGYLIGPEDGLEIAVWRDETLKATVLVRPDGGISFPLAGDIKVAGRTTAQVRDELARRLQKYIPDAVVTVTVVRVASYRIYVLGRVNKPGDYPLGREVDVVQALSLAGGLTPFAAEGDIRILRKIDGRTVSIPFDYSRLRKDGDLSQNIPLKSGDVLLVP